jgi:hypothetical protein
MGLKNKLYVVLRARCRGKEAVQIHFRSPGSPAVRVAVGGGVCPGKRGGVERTGREARRGIVTATV